MAARTDAVAALVVVILGTGVAAASPASDADIIGGDPGWKIEDVSLRAIYFAQEGHGFQSQAGPPEGPGNEHAWIIEPWAQITIRQSARITHEVTIPVDIVTAASPDALDAISTASLRNEAAGADIRTTIKTSDTDSITTRVGFHWEEPLTSGTVGLGWRRSLADDNAALSINGALTVDGFDVTNQDGVYERKSARETGNVNVSFSQILSPTTVVDASYGATWQHGILAQTWNAVPITGGGNPAGERFPRDRLRHAIAGRIAQHIPLTHSTVKAWYRYYRDDFGLSAHTVELTGYQYLVPWLYVRAAYRFHHQTGVDFYTTELAMVPAAEDSRTADSDLAPFNAHEVGIGLVIVPERAPRALARLSLVADYSRYMRSNDLTINVFALGVGRTF